MNALAHEFDEAFFGLVFEQAGYGFEQSGFARPVGTQDGKNLLCPHFQRKTAKGVYPVEIQSFDIGYFKKRVHRSPIQVWLKIRSYFSGNRRPGFRCTNVVPPAHSSPR